MKIKELWARLIGNSDEFSFENRMFNAAGVIAFLALGATILSNIYLGLYPLVWLTVTLSSLQFFVYYRSRVKKKYKTGIIIFNICSYVLLTVSYYYNSGVSGPIIFCFFLTLQLIIAISPRKQYPIWIASHVIIVTTLLTIECLHPDWIPDTYKSRADHFFDISSTYILIVFCIYLITNYMRRSYDEQHNNALEKTKAIEKQNELMSLQKAELQRSNEEKDKLFSIIAHDLRSPLNSIQSFLELLSEHELEQDEKLLIERELLALTKNTSDMLFNLLSWSKAQMDGVTVKCKPVSLYQTLEKTLETQRMIANKKSIQLINDIDPGMSAMADPDMLQLVIRNIVNNAIKFTPDHGEILVQSNIKNDDCVIMVRDNGMGISFEQQNELFSLKVKSSYGTNNEKGIGLGLILCKEYVELQGGRIWFQSTPKVGTAFYISLPVGSEYANHSNTALHANLN